MTATTTATLLAQAIVREGMKALEEGANPMLLRRGIEDATELVVAELRARCADGRPAPRPLPTSPRSPPRRMSGSARGGRALHRVGPEGVVTIERGRPAGIEVEFVEGMHVDNGHFSPYLIQDTQRMETVFDDPYILLTNKPIVHIQDLMPTLGRGDEIPRPAAHLRREVDGVALDCSVQNNQHGTLKAMVVRAPGSDTGRLSHLHDLAAFTGGPSSAREAGLTLHTSSLERWVRACGCVSPMKRHCPVEGAGTAEQVEAVWARSGRA